MKSNKETSDSAVNNDNDNKDASSSSTSSSSPAAAVSSQKWMIFLPSILVVIVAYYIASSYHPSIWNDNNTLFVEKEEQEIDSAVITEKEDDVKHDDETHNLPESIQEEKKQELDEIITDNNNNNNEENALYVIGDLHGDITCARKWVHRTGLIENFSPSMSSSSSQNNISSQWKWKDKTSKLLFLGDYIDKGPYSLQVVQLVKSLTDAFPEQVIAIMGNHELELLRDRDEDYRSPHFYYQLPYATVHPGEYLNFIPDEEQKDDDSSGVSDEVIIDLLYNASIEVYSQDAYESTIFAPSVPPSLLPSHTKCIVDYIHPAHYRPIVASKLASYQRSYLNTFRSNTTLGQWMESLPIFYVSKEQNGILFVHGGISHTVSTHLTKGYEDVTKINTQFQLHAGEDTINTFLSETLEGRIVDDVIFHRGNHLDEGGSCEELTSILQNMEGVERIAVGHTPSWDVRMECDGRFLALDSMLGRWIRGAGNEYCPMEKADVENAASASVDVDGNVVTTSSSVVEPRISLNGRYQCERINHVCEGQIVRIRDNGKIVEVIDDLYEDA